MKTAKLFAKIIAIIMVVAILSTMFVGCESKSVMTYTVDGVTYTITENEYRTFMKIVKANVFTSYGISSAMDEYVWSIKINDETGETYEEYYSAYVENLMKSTLVEKYLFDKYDLELDSSTLEEYKTSIDTINANFGGKGAYKQYFGYTAKDYFDYYQTAIDKSAKILDLLYESDNALDPVTDEEVETYYNEKYSNYMVIYLDMNNSIAKDEDGNYIGLDSSSVEYKLAVNTDENGVVTIENLGRVDGKPIEHTHADGEVHVEGDEEVVITSFKMTALDEDGVAEKSNVPALIANAIENGEDFKSLALKYSDSYVTFKFEDGVYVTENGYIVNNEAVMSAARKLEIGENTGSIEVSDGKYVYIIKRVPLAEKAYLEEEYEDLFASFEDDVMYDKYQKVVDTYINGIVVDEETLSKFTMKDTFLTKYVDSANNSTY